MIHCKLHRLNRTRSTTHDYNFLPPHIHTLQLTGMTRLPSKVLQSLDVRNRHLRTSPDRNNNPIKDSVPPLIPINNPSALLHLHQPLHKTPEDSLLPQPIPLPQLPRPVQNLISFGKFATPLDVRVEFVEV